MRSTPSVWVCCPVALKDRALAFCARWRARGYNIALQQDEGTTPWVESRLGGPGDPPEVEALTLIRPWRGVWRAWNDLAREALARGADVCVLVGDDMDPDPNHEAVEIGRQYLERFPDGFGVMQPTGDRQGDIIGGLWNSQRICGSPWVGRGWIERAYEGHGPVDARYQAFYADESMLHVARKLGVLWQREDLTQLHRHWSWGHTPRQPYHERAQRSWIRDKALFERSRAVGFPEGRPL